MDGKGETAAAAAVGAAWEHKLPRVSVACATLGLSRRYGVTFDMEQRDTQTRWATSNLTSPPPPLPLELCQGGSRFSREDGRTCGSRSSFMTAHTR